MCRVSLLFLFSARIVLVSRGRLLRGKRVWSIQFPIIISFLTHQGFLGVLIGLVTNGGTRLPFFGMLFRETEDLPFCCFYFQPELFHKLASSYSNDLALQVCSVQCPVLVHIS